MAEEAVVVEEVGAVEEAVVEEAAAAEEVAALLLPLPREKAAAVAEEAVAPPLPWVPARMQLALLLPGLPAPLPHGGARARIP